MKNKRHHFSSSLATAWFRPSCVASYRYDLTLTTVSASVQLTNPDPSESVSGKS